MRKAVKYSRIAALALALSLAAACSNDGGTGISDSESEGLDPLKIRLNWTYEAADHPWFMAGMEQGIYAEHGIKLELLEGTGSASTLQLVDSGSDPVGLVDAGTMMGGVSKGMKVRSTCVLAQKNPMSAIFPADASIDGLDDLRGKTVAVTPGDSLSQIFPAVLAANGMSEKDLKLVGLADPAAKQSSVVTGASDAFLGYYTLQLPALEQSTGIELDYLSFSELGVDTLSMAVVVNNEWAEKNEDLLERFVAATQEAVEYVVDNPDQAADDFVAAVPTFDRELAAMQIEATIPLLHTKATEGEPVCRTAESDWQATQDLLAEHAGLKPAPALDSYYTNEFIK